MIIFVFFLLPIPFIHFCSFSLTLPLEIHRRHHQSYFNQSNFFPLFLICLSRTLYELCTLLDSNHFWSFDLPSQIDRWCQSQMFILIYLLFVISSLFAVFLFQNVILLVMANKIYLTKSYLKHSNALKRIQMLQIIFSITFPLLSLILLFLSIDNFLPNCWPNYDHQLFKAIYIVQPIIQALLVSIDHHHHHHHHHQRKSSLNTIILTIFIAFNRWNRPFRWTNMSNNYFSTSKFRHCLMWTSASLIYLICIIGCLCYTLHHQNTSYASIGIDIAISLAFLMFARVKYLFNLLIECKTALIDGANRSSPTESNGSERHCFSANIINGQESVTSSIDSKQTRDNSISILSDASKTFLTMMPNGQISIGSPKIYPSHQSSYIYHNDYGDRSNQSNPNAHLYESPSHLYNYEFDRRCFSTRKHPHSTLNTNQLRGKT
ncbi:hypothetical protein QR98_0043380 [Sarcoptes scabiei]|uniref:Uncharacterized protein n=1 Tax=Sarcoptes scabiei TaxID=52283 RepID=A0A132A4F6_SARSC|nr:hypothetical protein QR98_0043380 [Sarcoptes scabiei]